MMMADGLIPTRVRTFAVRGQALNCKNLPLHQASPQSSGYFPTRVRTFAVRGQAPNCKNLPLHQANARTVITGIGRGA